MSEKPSLAAIETLTLVEALRFLSLREWTAWVEKRDAWDAAAIKSTADLLRLQELERVLSSAALAVIADHAYELTGIEPGRVERVKIDRGLLHYLSIGGWEQGLSELYREDVEPPRLAFIGVEVVGVELGNPAAAAAEIEQVLARLDDYVANLPPNASKSERVAAVLRKHLVEGRVQLGMTLKELRRLDPLLSGDSVDDKTLREVRKRIGL